MNFSKPMAAGVLIPNALHSSTLADFEGMHVPYLRLTCGPRLVRLEDALGEYLGTEEDTDAEGTAAVLGYLDACRLHAYFDPTRDTQCPHCFEDAAWPSFVDSICEETRA